MNCDQVESDKMNQEQVERHTEESLEKSLKEKNDEEESDEEESDEEKSLEEESDEEKSLEEKQNLPLTQNIKDIISELSLAKRKQIKRFMKEKELSFDALEKIYKNHKIDGLTSNDFYKFVMGPVLYEFNVLNTFSADLRDVVSQKEIQNPNSPVIIKLIDKLQDLKHRYITENDVSECISVNPKLKEFFSRTGASLFENALVSEIIVGRGPNEEDDEFLKEQMKTFIYIYYGLNAKTKRNEWIIQSRGMCAKNSWVETSMMQIIYQTFLEDYCEKNGITKEQYIATCIVREIITIIILNKKTTCKYALFAGRRSCFPEFLILQNYIFFKLMNHDKIIGSSSMWSILSLRKMGFDIPYPWVGTIAHEMFMMAQAMFKDYDNNEDNVSVSQAIVLYMYMILSHKEGTPFPCLPDTLGTKTCFRALQAVMITVTNEDGSTTEKSLLEYVGMLRKDSGKIKDFQDLSKQYPELSNAKIMDSEIGNILEAILSNEAGIMIIGAGGLFGEAQIPDEFLTEEERIILGINPKLKMAIKVTEVTISKEAKEEAKGEEEESVYPVKTGDGTDAGKLSIHPNIPSEIFDSTMERVKRTQDANDKPAKKRNISHTVISGKMHPVLTERE
jgi:hypothetical protein